jgi:hypothetical protein
MVNNIVDKMGVLNMLEDITNESKYLTHHCVDDFILYNIQVEEKNYWRTIAFYKRGTLLNYEEDYYKILFEENVMKIYRKGKLKY